MLPARGNTLAFFAMRLRTSKTLNIHLDGGLLRIVEIFSQKEVSCEAETIYWLAQFSDWTNPDAVCQNHPDVDAGSLVEQFDLLVELGFLLREGSIEALSEDQTLSQWCFAAAATTFHFATQNLAFMSLEKSCQAQIEKIQIGQSPALYTEPINDRAISLPPDPESPLLGVMAKRRTIRNTRPTAITRQALSDCLFAGLGITGFVAGSAELLPLKMTPSGGARNPYEAYVCVRNVVGLDQGMYHYLAVSNELEKVADWQSTSQAALVGGQDWAETKSATILLVAKLERTMWKYSDDNGYKVVLIEAGHIAQNIALMATAHGLTACPTAALANDLIKSKLGLSELTHAPVYAICLGEPEEAEPGISPNPRLAPQFQPTFPSNQRSLILETRRRTV